MRGASITVEGPDGGRSIELTGSVVSLGSGDDAGIRFSNAGVAPIHAVLLETRQPSGSVQHVLVAQKPEASVWPVRVNDVRIVQRALRHGDQISLGNAQLGARLSYRNSEAEILTRRRITFGAVIRALACSALVGLLLVLFLFATAESHLAGGATGGGAAGSGFSGDDGPGSGGGQGSGAGGGVGDGPAKAPGEGMAAGRVETGESDGKAADSGVVASASPGAAEMTASDSAVQGDATVPPPGPVAAVEPTEPPISPAPKPPTAAGQDDRVGVAIDFPEPEEPTKDALTTVMIQGLAPRVRPAPTTPWGGGGNFFEARGDARKIAFVVDKSSSMSGNRLERTKVELIEAIGGLRPDQSFYVVFFDEGAEQMPDSSQLLIPARSG